MRGPDGAWQSEATDPDGRDLVSAMQSIGSVTSLGEEQLGSRAVTVLGIDQPIDLGTLGGVRAPTATADASLQILVDGDGNPVLARFVFGPSAPGAPSVESLEITFHAATGSGTIAPPTPWKRYESNRGYALLMPGECTPLEGTEHWENFDCQGRAARIWAYKTADSLEGWAQGSIQAWKETTSAEPDLEDTLRVGTRTSGEPGWIATYRYVDDGLAVVMSDGLFVHRGTGFDFIIAGAAENETRDRALFLQMLATLAFTE